MASVAILVNGLPGAGKSSLARQLGGILGAPVLAKDALKETFGALLPDGDSARLGSIAMDTLWRLAAETDGGVIVDAVLDRTRDLESARRGLEVAGSPRMVELWCDVPVDVARARFAERATSRAGIHREWDAAFEGFAPLALGPVVRVDTSGPVEFEALVLELGQHFL
ncbi:AAA family ATPase [Schumannella sp. 10F1B-5-1]|uniref:AAA family ATPase n=1 Tax=Schumannella sp. 10F1B-5-1 TaxID=2590780 RepID=UPI0011326B32|nr:AAA family ATPase [Schumannella sp. 10F1B-5-1]TPW72845.1 AAA family ATPase [Schumannella sp. 10F1B-5-1]